MKKLFLFVCTICISNARGQNLDYPIQAVPFTKVNLTDNFWLPRIKTNATVTIPASFERIEATGRMKNFDMAAAKSGKFCTIYPFDDTDPYKTIEGASFSMSLYPDAALDNYIDKMIDKIGKAQEPDGYLYTARTIDPLHPHEWAGTQRWEKERELSHELYNAGHLYEAAAAHFYSSADVKINNKPVSITQQNDYPWQGNLKFTINPTTPGMFNFLVRIPGWARGEAMPGDLYTFADKSEEKVIIKVNGKPVEYNMQKGYAIISQLWKKNDVVEVELPMEVRKVMANSQVKDDIGKLALQRGPLMYCAEWADNNGKTSNIILPAASTFITEFKPDLLNGVMTLKSSVPVIILCRV